MKLSEARYVYEYFDAFLGSLKPFSCTVKHKTQICKTQGPSDNSLTKYSIPISIPRLIKY